MIKPTSFQQEVIKRLFDEYKINCEQYVGYNTADYCSFNTYIDAANPDVMNVVVVTSTITGITDYGIPETTIKNFLIEYNGSFYEMDMMPEVFRNKSEIVEYLQKLEKFDWNAE